MTAVMVALAVFFSLRGNFIDGAPYFEDEKSDKIKIQSSSDLMAAETGLYLT